MPSFVDSPSKLWLLYNQSKSFKCRPSDILFVEDELAAYSLNNAVWVFGTALEAALNAVHDKDPKREQAKRQRVLEKWIPEAKAPDAPAKPAPHKFATPRATM